mmetsp:Transcript_88268/g.175414  ORF Transcript_88268/g.175414 Transcript_88268/m.175414 type:complete len:662 (+) Transcript_88268:70-2055(+)
MSEWKKKKTNRQDEEMRIHQGTIKFFDKDKGYGFIRCQEAADTFGQDVFMHHTQLNDLLVGDHVQFRIQVNARGKPQAHDLRAGDPLMRSIMKAVELHGTDSDEGDVPLRLASAGSADVAISNDVDCHHMANDHYQYLGTIKFLDSQKGFGFIRCDETYRIYGKDVYATPNQVDGFRVGDQVRFSMKENLRGHPQAISLMSAPPPRNGRGAAPPGLEHMNGENGDSNVYHGVVKKIDGDRGFGFLACQQILTMYGSDVFASQKQLDGLEIGDRVSFYIKVNKKGQPQAIDVTRAGPVTPGGVDPDMVEEESASTLAGMVKSIDAERGYGFVNSPELQATYGRDVFRREDHVFLSAGTIKSFDAEHGYGFICSPEVQATYGRDVFLHSKQIKHFRPSDHVTFSVKINSQGHPQAYNLQEAPNTVAWLAVAEDEDSPPDKQRFEGEIKSFNGSHGYGFIECTELRDKYDRDVFIRQSKFDGLKVGDRVSFTVKVKKRQPQAHDVARIALGESCAASSAGPSGEGAATSPQKGDASDFRQHANGGSLANSELNRKLLRACASARGESVPCMEDLLTAGADANSRDIIGQTPLMISALNSRQAERKCRLLIEHRANPDAMYNDSLTVLQWARERINPKFASYLEGLQHGTRIDYTVALEIPHDND